MKGPELGEMDIRRVRLSDLKPAQYNPRTITDKASTGLGKSMERFGDLLPIVWNERTGNIVGGHQRYKKLLEDGQEETDVVVVDLDDNEEVALNIALNSRELRGDFTKEVMTQLKLCEVRLGDVFGQIGLDDLYNSIKNVKLKELEPSSGSVGVSDDGPGLPPVRGPVVAVTCPRCQSVFRMKDGKVLKDMTGKDGKNV